MARKKEKPFEWITGKDAAIILQISDRQVRRLGTIGKIEMKEVSPRIRLFLKSDIEEYAAKPRRKTRSRKVTQDESQPAA